MKRSGIMPIIALVAIVLVATFVWKPALPYAGLQFLASSLAPAPPATEQSPTPQETPTPEPSPEPSPEQTAAPETYGPPRARCFDGSPLTITSREGAQTNYRCGSGAIGAYTN